MENANMQIVVLVVILASVAAIFIFLKSLKLPNSYYKNEKARTDIRSRLREQEYEEKHPESNEKPEE